MSAHDKGQSNNRPIEKPLIVPVPSFFPHPFMFHLVIAYLDDQDVILSLLLVNKAMKPYLIGYRLKASIKQHALEFQHKHEPYLRIAPTQVTDVTDLASLFNFASITSVQLSRYNAKVVPDMLPQSVTELHLGDNFNKSISRNSCKFPAQLKKLTFSDKFNQPIPAGVLPDALESLCLGKFFDQPLTVGSLPASLTFLNLGRSFKQPLQPGILSPKLTKLMLPDHFNHKHSLGILPASLLCLQLGEYFTQRLEPGDLPSSITHLRMGSYFNYELPPGVIPASVIKLELSEKFNQPLVPGCFPDTLHSMALGCDYNHAIAPCVLPMGLKYLALSDKFDKSLDDVLPAGLVKLSGSSELGRRSLSHDRVDLKRSQSFMSPGKLPSSITDLIIRGKHLQPGSIPSSVTRLRLESAIAPGVIPNSVTHLVWDTDDALDVGVVPSSVTHLTFGFHFRGPIPESAIPSSVIHLAFGEKSPREMNPCFVPDTIMYVDLTQCSFFIRDVILPASVYCVAIRNRRKLVTRPPFVVSHSLDTVMCRQHVIPDSFLGHTGPCTMSIEV